MDGQLIAFTGAAAGMVALPGADAGVDGGPTVTGARRSLRQGFLTNALKPKAPVLFLSLLPQFRPDGQPPVPRTLLLATGVVLLALIRFPAVAVLVDRLGRWLRRPRTARAIEGAAARRSPRWGWCW